VLVDPRALVYLNRALRDRAGTIRISVGPAILAA
jgi:hypothetical protein